MGLGIIGPRLHGYSARQLEQLVSWTLGAASIGDDGPPVWVAVSAGSTSLKDAVLYSAMKLSISVRLLNDNVEVLEQASIVVLVHDPTYRESWDLLEFTKDFLRCGQVPMGASSIPLWLVSFGGVGGSESLERLSIRDE